MSPVIRFAAAVAVEVDLPGGLARHVARVRGEHRAEGHSEPEPEHSEPHCGNGSRFGVTHERLDRADEDGEEEAGDRRGAEAEHAQRVLDDVIGESSIDSAARAWCAAPRAGAAMRRLRGVASRDARLTARGARAA
eukprot:CAMPEP_0119426900 /NCGR_PEP_ID=MMETSP1335-20130426/37256_1 /TAXON_ID=259385 /ORGANISM="Chrysoculter rhomboideus, Strain RCC1486" /LENGTH=135 /DNA_ID=CAMNT_0007452515 /DNA_START=272 /DNA_END=678 /DNA_ORIENTATION=-